MLTDLHEMCQNCVSHEAGAKEVLLCYVINGKFYPDDNGCSLRCGNDTLRRRRKKILIGTLSLYNKLVLLAHNM